ncbi:cyclophane-forming radical SAM/SPASM peptide maturase YhhB [Pedobacter sp. Leaf176]|uniref:cyclophane-forming radical SAM/SPASM peptide maturase YhhB n=1 Tax=Pedobacter sp. Leaf176 TaxID=1736286 RepID=UPI0018D22AB2|nr:cyclophane-forming radical SAM/SPASM peptide maturase YhhB [Pedobacter sp. Leaf176]
MVDKVAPESEVDTVLVKVASRCNINCTYCYVYHMGDDNWSRMSKFMDSGTIAAMCGSFSQLVSQQEKPFSVVLHGGEPFLLGKRRLFELLEALREVLPERYPISIQTNGILISDEILDICLQFHASVAVSIDGPEHIHDRFRVGHSGEGTFAKVLRGIKTLSKHRGASFLNAGLLAVIDPSSDPLEIYHFFKSLAAPSVDFLCKDGNHDRLPLGKQSLFSVEYGDWMVRLMDQYLSDPEPLPIRVLDDMMKVLLGGAVSKEGIGLTDFGILIIDTDGTVMKNDTLKSSYNGADRFEEPVNVKEGSLIPFIHSEGFLEYKKMQRPVHARCRSCPKLDLCGGGMILHRWSEKSGFDNPSVYCSDQIYLIEAMQNRINKLIERYV